jgi:ferredoxin--NADP+ reductase
VILRVREGGERIPLTIKAADPAAGTITICVQSVGKTTSLLNCLETGDAILDIVGPLGHPSEIKRYGTAAVVAGSVGTAMALPTARALMDSDNHVIFIEGARSREMVVFEDEVRAVSHEAYVLTDDGTYGEKGLVTDKLKALLADGRKIDFVLAVGPVPMMRAVARMTAPLGIMTMVSLNSIMVDGTGMCGGCRVLLGDQSKFACVDGPEFDAAQVNFEVLMQRNTMYRDKESQSLKEFEEHKEEEVAQLRADLAAKAAKEQCHA